MSDCRPITVCATIYRLFATVITRQVLEQWAEWLPEGLKGAIPGRSSRDTALGIELSVEQALLRKASLMGLSLDLKKFFNKIPRPPILFLLSHMGLPDAVLSVWGDFLQRGFRLPSIRGHLGVPIPSTNGVFEGDPLSILAQASINWHMFNFTTDPALCTHSFVDNWAWVTGVRFSFGRILNVIQTFCAALSLDISWSKSFAWATRAEDRVWIRQVSSRLLPAGEGLVVVMAAQDLGVAFRYRVRLGRGSAEARLAEGRQRMTRLEGMPRSLPSKARLLRQSVWPASLYGLEAHLIPAQTVSQLRTRAARALLGRKTSMSPFLALAVLFPFPLDPGCFFCRSRSVR